MTMCSIQQPNTRRKSCFIHYDDKLRILLEHTVVEFRHVHAHKFHEYACNLICIL